VARRTPPLPAARVSRVWARATRTRHRRRPPHRRLLGVAAQVEFERQKKL
jgi:hypothetical protein